MKRRRRSTDASAGREIEIEISMCVNDNSYVGTISYPPDDINPWTILHAEHGTTLQAVRAGLRKAIQQHSWPCRYCGQWMADHGATFLRDGKCMICDGRKLLANTAFPLIDDFLEVIDDA